MIYCVSQSNILLSSLDLGPFTGNVRTWWFTALAALFPHLHTFRSSRMRIVMSVASRLTRVLSCEATVCKGVLLSDPKVPTWLSPNAVRLL